MKRILIALYDVFDVGMATALIVMVLVMLGCCVTSAVTGLMNPS